MASQVTCGSGVCRRLQRQILVVVVEIMRLCCVILAVDVATGSSVVVVENTVRLDRWLIVLTYDKLMIRRQHEDNIGLRFYSACTLRCGAVHRYDTIR